MMKTSWFQINFNIIIFIVIGTIIVPTVVLVAAAPRQYEERYSFSLTTFDPTGRLGQVDRAQQAASMGTPIIAIIIPSRRRNNNKENNSDTKRKQIQQQQQNGQSFNQSGCIILASPQYLPGIFMIDDGTTRFTQLTDSIVLSHSGLSADGRVLITAAQKIAIEHEYTFEEEISCQLLLEQLSLLLQSYTMKPGTRPFGANIIVAYVPKAIPDDSTSLSPELYRIDTSGNIESLCDDDDDDSCCSIINGNNFLQQHTDLAEKLEQLVENIVTQRDVVDIDIIQDEVAELIRDALSSSSKNKEKVLSIQEFDDVNEEHSFRTSSPTILSACLYSQFNQNSFSRKRHELKS
jgi:20S proteasome alpha/beta subunit